MKKVKFLMVLLSLFLVFGIASCSGDGSGNGSNQDVYDDEEIPEDLENCCTIIFHSNYGNKEKTYVQYFPMTEANDIEDLYKKLKPCKFTRDGYIFEGWAKEKDSTEADYKDEATVTRLLFIKGGTLSLYSNPELIKEVHFYAVWTDASKLVITYKRNYKSENEEDIFTVTVPVVDNKATYRMAECPFEPESEDYVFVCWNGDNYTGETREFESTTSRRLSYYARWANKNNTFTEEKRYYKDINSDEYVIQYYNWSDMDELAILDCPFTMPDAEFVGWATSRTAKKPDYQPYDRIDTFGADSYLFALWSRDITLTFNSNTGNDSQTQTMTVKSYKPQVLSDKIFTNGNNHLYSWATQKTIANRNDSSIVRYGEDEYFNMRN